MNIMRKGVETRTIIIPTIMASTTAAAMNIPPIVGDIMNVITDANIKSIGARTSILIHIWNASCTLLTSVVIRVIRLAVEKLSMLAKE